MSQPYMSRVTDTPLFLFDDKRVNKHNSAMLEDLQEKAVIKRIGKGKILTHRFTAKLEQENSNFDCNMTLL